MQYAGYSVSVRGASHEKSGLPCQDSARTYAAKSLAVAAVSDGHGSERHFRSASGSEMATRIAIRSIADFSERNGGLDSFFRDNPDKAARRIAANIICGWNSEIAAHLCFLPLDENECAVSEKYGGLTPEIIYGATLIVGAALPQGFFGLQIGDGSFVCDDGGIMSQPMPGDERLVGNLTTSLCDVDAIHNFRYFYSTGKCSAAVLSSDGLVNSFASTEDFLSFNQRLTAAVQSGQTGALPEHLRERSAGGSRDDISAAVLVALHKSL